MTIEDKVPNNNNNKRSKGLSYDDILAKMSMRVVDGQLFLEEDGYVVNSNQVKQRQVPLTKPIQQPKPTSQGKRQPYWLQDAPQQFQPSPTEPIPLTRAQYTDLLVKDLIQRRRIQQMKSTKLIMPTSNIQMSTAQSNLNRLFKF